MEGSFGPIKFCLASIGCIIVFSIPVVGILAIWGFDPDNIKQGFTSIVALEKPSDNNDNDYNFEIPAGEDALLTSTIKNESRTIEVTPRSNPAQQLVIESAQIEGPIVYGQDGEELLKQGFWHYPGSAYIGEQGVSIIFGHRRHHLPPAKDTFYNLDKVSAGDRVEILLQDGTWLEYTVMYIEVVEPEDLFFVITEQSQESLVKFITCTPLGTANQRLVVTAKKTF